jgi:hypothetical protein
MTIHTISVAPAHKRNGEPLPGKFDALANERRIVAASRTPFCDSARVLLAEGLAAPSDVLIMRHVGSQVDALKAAVGVAAKLTVNETAGTGTPRFEPYRQFKAMPGKTSEGDAPMRETDPEFTPSPTPGGLWPSDGAEQNQEPKNVGFYSAKGTEKARKHPRATSRQTTANAAQKPLSNGPLKREGVWSSAAGASVEWAVTLIPTPADCFPSLGLLRNVVLPPTV